MSALHISISAETIAHVGPLPITNSMLTSVLVSVLVVGFALLVNSGLKTKGRPSRLQSLAELIIEALYNLCMDITDSSKKARTFAPLIISFFLFIVMNNWAGLIPGVGSIGFRKSEHAPEATLPAIVSTVKASTPAKEAVTEVKKDVKDVKNELKQEPSEPTGTVEKKETTEEKGEFVPFLRAGTADLNTTIALAVISVIMTQIFGVMFLGAPYFQKYINFSSPIMFFVGVLETILEIAKIMSFAFRLFGNIFAGEVLLAVMTFLVPIIVPMPFYGLELFVGMIQGLVFAMLSLVFFNLATIGHGDHEEHSEAHA